VSFEAKMEQQQPMVLENPPSENVSRDTTELCHSLSELSFFGPDADGLARPRSPRLDEADLGFKVIRYPIYTTY
jgi:hypothetical protein